ncbi:hypothetical protein Mal64_12400 [Pseudobythopirellula maris]|uniref:Signal peptidase I n=1 Tax=Pseudobythopirellula maris TaxID=2527991 RepID=A0A5C5ZX06_9BACT|nr:DUF5684 domain-containing protein [Pseudobythopirellula maris]TWT90843.1 hypothetical protein Mal64_12400 [Pseudobythopirellula maris]
MQGGDQVAAVIVTALFCGVLLGIALYCLAGAWKVFGKAGLPGWFALVPLLNAYLICKIAGKPGWWVVLLFVPLVNLVVLWRVVSGLAMWFGKTDLYAVGLFLVFPLFFAMIGHSTTRYRGLAAGSYVRS